MDDDGINENLCPAQPEPAVGSSQSFLVGVRHVGELNGGVTGALIDPPAMYRWCESVDEADDEPEERFLSQGINEFGSALPFEVYR